MSKFVIIVEKDLVFIGQKLQENLHIITTTPMYKINRFVELKESILYEEHSQIMIYKYRTTKSFQQNLMIIERKDINKEENVFKGRRTLAAEEEEKHCLLNDLSKVSHSGNNETKYTVTEM